MAATDYQILQAQTEFPSTSTPRVFYKIGLPVAGAVGMVPIKPNGTVGTLVAMTKLGASDIYYADFADAFTQGTWCFLCEDDGEPTTSPLYGAIQWGGTVDLLCQGAEDAAMAKQNSGKSAKIGGNRFEVDAGTGIGTLYDDDGTTPMATRTVQNGDGSPLSEAQVLKLGMFA